MATRLDIGCDPKSYPGAALRLRCGRRTPHARRCRRRTRIPDPTNVIFPLPPQGYANFVFSCATLRLPGVCQFQLFSQAPSHHNIKKITGGYEVSAHLLARAICYESVTYLLKLAGQTICYESVTKCYEYVNKVKKSICDESVTNRTDFRNNVIMTKKVRLTLAR